MELGRQTRGSGASGSFREDRAGAPPALRSIQWSLHRGTSLTSRTGGQLGTKHNSRMHAHQGWQASTFGAAVGTRHHDKVQRIWWSWPKSAHPDILCLVLLCRRVVVWPVSYVQIGMPGSLLIASEGSRDWQRARVHGARSRQGDTQGPRSLGLGRQGSHDMV